VPEVGRSDVREVFVPLTTPAPTAP